MPHKGGKMYYQTQAVSKDQSWTTCTIIDTTKESYIVEYTENGKFLTKEIKPEELQKLDYSELEISQ
jgi:hypothetical protein